MREAKRVNEEERKGEQELARIIKIFSDHYGEWLSVRDVARMLTGREDEATLRRIRRKLKILRDENVLVSKETRPKLFRFNLRYSPEDYHVALEHSKRVVLGFFSIMGEYSNDIKEALRRELKRKGYPEELCTRLCDYQRDLWYGECEQMRPYALKHLETGYPEVYELYNRVERLRGCLLHRRWESDFHRDMNNTLEERFKRLGVVLLNELIDVRHPDNPAFRIRFTQINRKLVLDICTKALREYYERLRNTRRTSYNEIRPPKLLLEVVEADGYGYIMTEDGLCLGIGDEEILKELNDFLKYAYKRARELALDVIELEHHVPELEARLRDELMKIVEGVIRGRPLKGVCLLCPETGPREKKEGNRTSGWARLWQRLRELFELFKLLK